jgi:hypothetical protein
MAVAFSAAPDRSIPQIAPSEAELGAFYHLLNRPSVRYMDICAPHFAATADRIAEARVALAIHDTSEVSFSAESPRQGLGPLGKRQGFLMHVAIAVTADDLHRPLGALGLVEWARSRRKRKDSTDDPTQSEALRWGQLVDECGQRVRDRADLIHVMDREGDAFPLFAQLVDERDPKRFVIRLGQDRLVTTEEENAAIERLHEVVARAEDVMEVMVPIAERKAPKQPNSAKTFKPRPQRVAKLAFSATTLLITRPAKRPAKGLPALVSVNVARVHEIDVPDGQEPIEWLLATTESIATREDVVAIVNHYRARWIIEEFFKALKTGCALETRQLETRHALLNVLALSMLIAWQLLLLRHLFRASPDAPATAALTPTQLSVLSVCGSIPLGPRPTVREALYAVARMGGHVRTNGDPGWLVLGRGMAKLRTLSIGWAARDALRVRNYAERSAPS